MSYSFVFKLILNLNFILTFDVTELYYDKWRPFSFTILWDLLGPRDLADVDFFSDRGEYQLPECFFGTKNIVIRHGHTKLVHLTL